MRIGTAYYPEYHAEAEWDRDLARVREAGIDCIRFAEFAWSQIEPEPGRFDTAWMERALSACQRHGITAVIGTPTATPPVWLVEASPEIMPVDDSGRRTGFGFRQHRCYNAQAYRAASRRVVEHLAITFGKHPAVIGWQIDNELGGEQKSCHCDLCRTAWHGWLAGRYAGIADLNRRWGTAFWSHTYSAFSQIPVPVRSAMQLGLKHHPSLTLEWLRFSSDAITDFCQEHAALLRRHVRPGAVITTNNDSFTWGENVDLRKLFSGLDVVGFDLYTQHAYEIAFYCDFMHDVLGKPFWFMEYDTSSPKLTGELDAIAASGECSRLFFFKFRPFPWGHEQGTRSLLNITGTPAPNHAVVAAWTKPARTLPTPIARRVGLVYDFDSSWATFLTGWSGIPNDLTYPRGMIDPVYRTLHGLGERARVVLRAADLHDLALVIAPWLVIHEQELEDALLRHVHAGGTALLTQDCFIKNRDNVYREQLSRLYTEALGCRDCALDHEPAGEHALIRDVAYGAGRIVMLSVKPDAAAWSFWLGRLLAKN